MLKRAEILRRGLHTVHAATFLFLLGTGLLLYSPTLRASFTGGYSLTLRWLHRWGGVAFVLLPLPLIAIAGRSAIRGEEDKGCHDPGWLVRWQGAHMLFTIGAAAIFTGTGMVIWLKALFPSLVVEWSYSLHNWLTYGSCVVMIPHLFVTLVHPSTRWFFRQEGVVALQDL